MGMIYLSGETPDTLQTLKLRIISDKACAIGERKKIFKEDNHPMINAYSKPNFGVVCTKNPPRSICSGDSGGPLICNVNGKAVIYGTASYTTRVNPTNPIREEWDHCGDTHSYYTDTYYFLKFIKRSIGQKIDHDFEYEYQSNK